MKTKAERFADSRNARTLSNARIWKTNRRRNSARAVAEWIDVRKDKRFALFALASKYEEFGIYLSEHVVAPLHAGKEFAQHDAIPFEAWRYAAAHQAKSDPAKIACYPTIADARRGREVVMTPGRFFAAIYPDMSPSGVQRMAEKYACATTPAQVHFAEDEDDFARVYASHRGFSSCMAGEWQGKEKFNPVRFYAHPENDLALAYLTHNNKPAGETVARSIVNTEKKLYVRVYGDARLRDLLEGLGYSHDARNALRNQKCNAREINGDLVAPYLDAIQRVSWDGVSDWCRICEDGEYEADGTSGIANRDDQRSMCDCCGDRIDEDEECYSDYHEITICQRCADRNYTYAIYTRNGDETYVRDHLVIRVGDQAYVNDTDVLSHHNLVCDEDGEWQDLDDCIFLEYRGEYVLFSQCTRLDFSYGDDDYARDCDLKTVHVDGEAKTVHEDWEDDDGITDEYKAEHAEEDEEEDDAEDLGIFPAAHARPDDSTSRLIATLNAEAGCNAAMLIPADLAARLIAIEHRAHALDQTCRDLTAFRSFGELLNAVGYRPSVNVAEPRLLTLANAYDAVQEARGDSRRAYRYANPRAAIESTYGVHA